MCKHPNHKVRAVYGISSNRFPSDHHVLWSTESPVYALFGWPYLIPKYSGGTISTLSRYFYFGRTSEIQDLIKSYTIVLVEHIHLAKSD